MAASFRRSPKRPPPGGEKEIEENIVAGYGGTAGGDYHYLMMLAYEEGHYDEMLRYARERSAETKRQGYASVIDFANPLNGRYEVAWSLAKAGKNKDSERLMDELKNELKPGLPQRQRRHTYFTALCALERGEIVDAMEQFDKSMDILPPNHPPEYHYAVALYKSGRMAEAIAEFQRMTWWSPIDDLALSFIFSPMSTYWPIAAVKAHYWLGLAYEQQGKPDLAAKEYQTFLDTWKSADFTSPEMEDARVKLERLKHKKI